MTATTRNTPQDVCRVIGIALLADQGIDDDEIAALAEAKIDEKLGISAADFRRTLQELCKEALFDKDGAPNASITELGVISDMVPLLGRETPADLESVSRLAELINRADPTLLADQLLNREHLNAALDRIDDRRLQLWTSSVLAKLIHADGELHDNEKLLASYVLNRWNISEESLSAKN